MTQDDDITSNTDIHFKPIYFCPTPLSFFLSFFLNEYKSIEIIFF